MKVAGKDRRTLTIVLSLLTTVIVLAIAFPLVKKAVIGETKDVLVAKKEFVSGDIITLDGFEEKSIPVKYLSKAKVYVGKEHLKNPIFANKQILAGDNLTKELVSPEGSGDKLTIGITVPNQAALGEAKKGNIVSVIGVGKDGELRVFKELKYVEIKDIKDARGNSISSEPIVNQEEEQKKQEASAMVTLLLQDYEQATILAELEQSKKWHFVLESKDNSKNEELLNAQRELLNN